jgi:hypothetical protein
MSEWTVDSLDSVGTLCAWIGFATLIAALVLFLIAILTRHSRRPSKRVREKSRRESAKTWLRKVVHVTIDYDSQRITEEEAYAQLSRIARDFASGRLGVDLSTQTLLDLNQRHQIGNKKQFLALRQTIAALYPAEFANSQTNRQADETSVHDAANWVETMIERWVA